MPAQLTAQKVCMNTKTNLLERYVNFVVSSLREHVDTTKKNRTPCKLIIVLFDITLSLFSFFLFLNTQKTKTFPLEQKTKTVNLEATLIPRQYKLDLMTPFRDLKSINPKLGHDQILNELVFLSSILQRFRDDFKIRSPYKSKGPKRTQKT